MPVPSPFAPFVESLERLGLPYCITGSVAASVYGEPRLTADVDVVLLLGMNDIAAFKAAFPESEYYVPPEETLRAETARGRGMFNLIHQASQFKADIYLAGTDPLHAWALVHRRRIAVEGGELWLAPPEYVVLRKLEWLREGGGDRHARDLRFILAATALDAAFVEREADRLGLGDVWHRFRPPI